MERKKYNSLFSDDRMQYIENSKNITKKLLDFINEFSEVARYKINIQKFLPLTTSYHKKETKEIIPFTSASKRIKYFGRNLTKDLKYLSSEHYKTLMKEIENDTTKWKPHCAHSLEELILLK